MQPCITPALPVQTDTDLEDDDGKRPGNTVATRKRHHLNIFGRRVIRVSVIHGKNRANPRNHDHSSLHVMPSSSTTTAAVVDVPMAGVADESSVATKPTDGADGEQPLDLNEQRIRLV